MFDKLKKPKKKMHDLHKAAKLDVLKDLSSQAADAMSVKIIAQPSDMPKAMDMAKDKVLDVIKDEHMSDVDSEDSEMEESEDSEMEESEYEEESEDEESEDDLDMGEELMDQVEDFSKVDPEEIDAKIEKLMKLREKMKVASV
jgi:hypothetical protein